MTIDPKETPVPKIHGYLLSAVAPRPIAFASTIDKAGNVNLSPFSFFNCFGANPPIVVFSPARSGRTNTTKNTLENVLEVSEVVINIVSYNMVQQMSLASSEYPKGVNEFVKAGFTETPSEKVRPPRVAESPVALECKVLQVIPTGEQGGAGNLVICEVVLMHIKDELIGEDGKIDPFKLDAVARMGSDWYCRANGDSLFRLPQPAAKLGIGFDQLPDKIKQSKILTGNDLAMLAGVEQIPDVSDTMLTLHEKEIIKNGEEAVHHLVKQYLQNGEVENAWKILIFNNA
ncbi:MAG: flavin reductase family protein [Cyclobacteriaceae bacterium]|nr:flavin reductase family protein [Cyclobacteriaceae bacterium]